MSEINTDQRGTGARETTASRPAVGLVARGEDGDAIAGAILRAYDAGHEPLVAASDPRVEGARFAEQLDVRVVYVDDLANGTEPDVWDELAEVARSGGYPGLLRHPEPRQRLDFEASRETMAGVSDYVVEPVLEARVGEAPDVLAAIPAYNESSAIEGVVVEARSVADEVLVIDDGSTDDTVELAREAGATVIEHTDNRGYGGALKTAFREADRAGAETLVILDGDGQHDPTDVPELVEVQRAEDAEIVIGSRFENGSETELPLYRTVGLRVVNVLTNLSLGVVRSESRISDTQSGFRAYSRAAISSLAGDEEIGDNMSASTDILYHAHREGYDVAEVGTTIDYTVEASSSQNPVSHGLQLVQNILRTVERERPVTVLGIPGFVSAVIGLGFGYATFSNYLTSGVFPLGLALVSVFFTLAGIFAAFTAIILHSLEMHSG